MLWKGPHYGPQEVLEDFFSYFKKELFSSCSLSSIEHDANNVAHLCAKQASSDRRICVPIN
jgi:hypothetical protein